MNNIRNFIKYIPYIIFLSNCQYTQKYTNWNIFFLICNKFFKIDNRIHLLNSVTIWSSFHIGGTDNAKIRFIRKNIDTNINKLSIIKFIIGDIVLHLLPALYWINICWKRKKYIKHFHIFNLYFFIFSYLLFVAKGLYCKEQYGKYPYKRQLSNLLLFPLLTKFLFNKSIELKTPYPLLILSIYTWYMKEYFDIYDGSQILKEINLN